MANPNPSPATRFQPGVSGNPGGYSKGRRQFDDILALIAEKGIDRAISTMFVKNVLEGDFRFVKEYLDRRDGKVPDTLITHEGAEPLTDPEEAAIATVYGKPLPDDGEDGA